LNSSGRLTKTIILSAYATILIFFLLCPVDTGQAYFHAVEEQLDA
jgi:hypothetical protein